MAYYLIMHNCIQETNWERIESIAVFSRSKLEWKQEIETIWHRLRDQSRFASGAKLALRLAKLLTDQRLKDHCQQLLGFCDKMELEGSTPLYFRAAMTRLSIADYLDTLGLSAAADENKKKARTLIDNVAASLNRTRDEFAPGLDFDDQLNDVKSSSLSQEEKLKEFCILAEKLMSTSNWVRANVSLINCRAAAQAIAQLKKPGFAELLRDTQREYLSFLRNHYPLPFFEAAALSDLFTTLRLYFKGYREILREYDDFQKKYPTFDIPVKQVSMLSAAIDAAQNLSKDSTRKMLQEQMERVYTQCSFVDSSFRDGLLTTEAQNNPNFYYMEIEWRADNELRRGHNAVKLMLRWMRRESNQGLLTKDEITRILHDIPDLPDMDNVLDFWEEVNRDEDIIPESFFGQGEPLIPIPSTIWRQRFEHLRAWLLQESRPPFRAARVFVLKVIALARAYTIRQRLAEKMKVETALNDEDVQEIKDMQSENEYLNEIVDLEAKEDPIKLPAVIENRGREVVNTIAMCLLPNVVAGGIIRNDVFADRAKDCDELVEYYKVRKNLFGEYFSNLQKARLLMHQHLLLASVPADAGIPALEEAERCFNALRDTLTDDIPADSFLAKVNIATTFSNRAHYEQALTASGRALRIAFQLGYQAIALRGLPNEDVVSYVNRAYTTFITWIQRSKARALTDVLGQWTRIPRNLLDTSRMSAPAAAALRKEGELSERLKNTCTAEEEKRQLASELDNVRKDMRGHAELNPIVDMKDAATITKSQLCKMVSRFGPNVVLVDLVNAEAPNILRLVVYRLEMTLMPFIIQDINMPMLQQWIARNMDAKELQGRPFSPGELQDDTKIHALRELSKLIEPLVSVGPATLSIKGQPCIKPGQTIVFSLTGALHRIPIHAIPVDGVPLIARNPVAYTQSFTILRDCYQYLPKQVETEIQNRTPFVVDAMPDVWGPEGGEFAGQAVQSKQFVAELAKELDANFMPGYNLKKTEVLENINHSTIIHYHGHVHFERGKSPMESSLLLNKDAYDFHNPDCKDRPQDPQELTANEIFDSKPHKPCLVTLMGCKSGRVEITSSDDLLGLSTAFHFAGASAIVSTLWSIEDEDGANFATEFYRHLRKQEADAEDNVDLAAATQAAVQKLRYDKDRKERPPYHWAAFVLNGYWRFPKALIFSREESFPSC